MSSRKRNTARGPAAGPSRRGGRAKTGSKAGRVEATLLFENATQIVTCAGPPRARRGAEMAELEVLENAVVAVAGDRILEVGARRDLLRRHRRARRIDCEGGVLMPALVDSHTHAVFGTPRFVEHELRAAGVDYMEIARRGGGIHSSVRDVRERSERELRSFAEVRLKALASHGVGTIEVKSGYGLTLADELKLLRVIRTLAAELRQRLVPTFMGAHEIPLEHRGSTQSRREYVDEIVRDMIPAVAADGLAAFADVFCETGVYSVAESREILLAARGAGMGIKLHADELTSTGGAELAAELAATSADHLAAISDRGIGALAASGTIATVLPATMLFLGKPAQAPARRMIEAGIGVALATDFNPGTSPTVSLPLVMSLAVSQLRLSAAESIVAATVNGAAALGLADRVGQLAPGYSADLALFGIRDYRELPYWLGARLCQGLWTRGKACEVHDLGVS